LDDPAEGLFEVERVLQDLFHGTWLRDHQDQEDRNPFDVGQAFYYATGEVQRDSFVGVIST